MSKLVKKIRIRTDINILTGLHIGGSSDNVEIGGIDNPVIKLQYNERNGQPYIPGSSLRGKIRCLLEQANGATKVGDDNTINRLFGFSNKNIASKLIVRDAYLTDESVRELKNCENLDLPYTEVKFENSIDRIKGTADNPRQTERVPAGAIFSAVFRIEGIQIDKAKFQIISILTGTGFTTNESELMLATRKRRKLTQIMILFSYIFNISIVSTIVNVFISSNNTSWQEIGIGIGLTILNVILIIVLNKSTKIRKAFDHIVIKISEKAEGKRINSISVYDFYGNKVIAEVVINNLNDKILNLDIAELKEKYDISLLVIRRGADIITDIDKKLIIQDKDILLVFGILKKIRKLFGTRNKK